LSDGQNELEFSLLLSSEQAWLLTQPPPILLSGTAGSGKTTLAVYFLLRPEYQGQRRLFVTYSPFQRDYARSLYVDWSKVKTSLAENQR